MLYNFDGVLAGNPIGNLSFDPAGNLYGGFYGGGLNDGCLYQGFCGGVFQFSPTKARWFFFDGTNGGEPGQGVLVDTKNASLFGTSSFVGGTYGAAGDVFQIQPNQETVLYTFCSVSQDFDCADGQYPSGPLVGRDGKLYGVTEQGGVGDNSGNGVVFQITP